MVAGFASVVRNASFALDLLMLASVPLAGLTAYLLLRKVSAAPLLRVWGAATYALLPAMTGALAAGRLGTVVAAAITPLVALAVVRTLGRPGSPGPFRASWSAGLLLAVMVAFVPWAWLIALVLGVIAIASVYRDRRSAVRVAAMLVVAPVVLMPWTTHVLSDLRLVFTEAGVPGPGLSEESLAPWAILFLHPGGPGVAPLGLAASLAVAAWVAVFRRDRLSVTWVAWLVAGVALVFGIVVSRVAVSGPTLETPVAGWPGYATVLIGAGFVVAVVAGADGARERLADISFGWRQPLAVTLAAVAALTPVVGAIWWFVQGADDPLDRRDARVIPAYVADEAARDDRIRTLLLDRADDGRITYALLRSSGPRLGDAEIGPPPEDGAPLNTVVANLISGRGGADAARLAEFAAKYVYLPRPADPDLADTLDAVPGLVRASAPDGAAMWRVDEPVARVWIAEPSEDGGEVTRSAGEDDVVTLTSGPVEAGGTVPDGPDGRLLVLAERANPGWSADLNGLPLKPTTYGDWAQAFELPESGGELEITHQGEQRQKWLWFQLVVVAVAIVLAAPGMQRQRGAIDATADLDVDDTNPDQLPAVPNLGVDPTTGEFPVVTPDMRTSPVPTYADAVPGRPVVTAEPVAVPQAAAPQADAMAVPIPTNGHVQPPAKHRQRSGRRRRKKGSESTPPSAAPARPRSADRRGGKRAAGKRAKRRRRNGGQT